MFYDNLKAKCESQGLKVSPVVIECGGAIGSINGWKKGSFPNSEILLKLSLRLNTTTDYLLTGKEEKEKSSESELTETELEMLEKFNRLMEIDKGRILDRMETILNSYSPEHKENVS